MGQGAGSPAGRPHLTLAFEEPRGQATAGSCVHGAATLRTRASSADGPTLHCEITCTARTQLDFPLQDDRIPGSAARRAVPLQTRRVQSRTAVLLHDAASAEQPEEDHAQSRAVSSYRWPVTVQLPESAPPTMSYRGVWLGAPDADVMAEVSWEVHATCVDAQGESVAEVKEPLTVHPAVPPAVQVVELWGGGRAMRSFCCGLWRTGRLRARLRFGQSAYRAGETALLLFDAHNKSSTDITEVIVRRKLCRIHPHEQQRRMTLISTESCFSRPDLCGNKFLQSPLLPVVYGQVILRRELRIRVTDDGGPSRTQLQRGKQASSNLAERDPSGVVLERYEEVLLSRSELGLTAGAYAWDTTARQIELPLDRNWAPSCESDAISCCYTVDMHLPASAPSDCGCCSETLSHVGLPLIVLPPERPTLLPPGGTGSDAKAMQSDSSESTQVLQPLMLHPQPDVDIEDVNSAAKGGSKAAKYALKPLEEPLLEKG